MKGGNKLLLITQGFTSMRRCSQNFQRILPISSHFATQKRFNILPINPISQNFNIHSCSLLPKTSWKQFYFLGLTNCHNAVFGTSWRWQHQLNFQPFREASTPGKGGTGRSIDCEDLSQLLLEGARFVLIDVRDKKDVEAAGVIETAINIPLSELKVALLMDETEFVARYDVVKPDKHDKSIIFYGLETNRSNTALEIASKLGFKNVSVMAGGYKEWVRQMHIHEKI